MADPDGEDEAERFAMPLGRRQRLVAGIAGIGIGFGGPFLLSVALIASSGDPSFLLLPLPFLGALWFAQGLSFTAVVLEPDGVRLERRWRSRFLPYAAISGCDREPRPVGGLGAVGLNALFGSHGWRFNRRAGWHYAAIGNARDLVWMHTAAGLIAVSPEAPDRFAAHLRARLSARRPG
jgi:hypothetical protein